MGQRCAFVYETFQQRVNGNAQPPSFLGKACFGLA
jgi:hypothetical protein